MLSLGQYSWSMREQQILEFQPVLNWRETTVSDGAPTLNRQRHNVPCLLIWSFKWDGVTGGCILPCKDETQLMSTWKVNNYYLLAVHGSIRHLSYMSSLMTPAEHSITLLIKGRIRHFTVWQIRPFITKGTTWTGVCFKVLPACVDLSCKTETRRVDFIFEVLVANAFTAAWNS